MFVWGNNDKLQLGMSNVDEGNEESISAKEVNVPH
jgi:hypothetical protein